MRAGEPDGCGCRAGARASGTECAIGVPTSTTQTESGSDCYVPPWLVVAAEEDDGTGPRTDGHFEPS